MTKARQLRKYKRIALLLLILMAVIYILSFFFFTTSSANGYIRAFAEAAMVGALADWFAVAALFRHPLGLPIPHTNLIENSKNRIGENLGGVVTDNFLSAQTIRPRIKQVQLAAPLGKWLSVPANRDMMLGEINRIALNTLNRLDDGNIEALIARESGMLLDTIRLESLTGQALESIVKEDLHQQWITLIASGLRKYLIENQDIVKDKVKEESHFLIPGFVDSMIAAKITRSAIRYFEEIADQPDHYLRAQISASLVSFASALRTEQRWEEEFTALKHKILPEERLREYSTMLWGYIRKQLMQDLSSPDSGIREYLNRVLQELAESLLHDEVRKEKTDRFVQLQVYKLVLRHKGQVSRLISTTIGNWKGRELSDKLELEVGKDLQFIRLNGTLVGGLVGLTIHALTEIFV